MAEASICIQSSWTVPRCLFPVSPSESSTLVLYADNLPALLELLFYAMNLLSHLATCWVVNMPLTENVVSGCLQKTFAMSGSGCICTCVVACDWWPHRHHPPTMLHIFHPPPERKREGERETTHWVGTGVQIRLPLAVPGGPLLCWWLFNDPSMATGSLYCLDGQMGKADGLIWHSRKVFFFSPVCLTEIISVKAFKVLMFEFWTSATVKYNPRVCNDT